MTAKGLLDRVFQRPALNFMVTNRIPRRGLTRFVGWLSRIEHPAVRVPSLAAFRLFADDLDLEEARQPHFRSLHDCFVRELKDGARPLDTDPATIVSPCDAIVGAVGEVRGGDLIQAKGQVYSLADLLLDAGAAAGYVGGRYATLRLKASMYHR
ncbi:MAG TPA: phosphatidylserine decarboxylase, partial [Vicinamibacteria bacterium]|nr:phosphatidylserine decarboxylase [Vicinamibacteria bacterium]